MEAGELQRTLHEIFADLRRLQEHLATIPKQGELEVINQELAALLNRFQREALDVLEDKDPTQTLARLQPLDQAFKRIARSWSTVLSNAGRAAAEELLRGADVYAGWQEYWGKLQQHAWKERDKILEQADVEPSLSRGQPAASGPEGLGLALDLRYVAKRSIAEIGSYLNLSPAAVQGRITEFEQRVVTSLVQEAIERQVPTGWRLVHERALRSFEPDRFVLREIGKPNPRSIMLEVLPVWGERESTAGRPRSLLRRQIGIQSRPLLRIWAVADVDSGDVLFVPESAMALLIGAGDVPPKRLVEHARDVGSAILGDAVQALIMG